MTTSVIGHINMRFADKSILVFLAMLLVFSAVANALVIHSHHETAALSRFIMWCPGFAALATCALLRIRPATLGWR